MATLHLQSIPVPKFYLLKNIETTIRMFLHDRNEKPCIKSWHLVKKNYEDGMQN